ncbi:MAG: hypothetical protein ACEQSR_12575 [Candidatus Methylacidiphilales bacterium]
MSGYYYSILMELENVQENQTIQMILKPFEVFIEKYIKKRKGVDIKSVSYIHGFYHVEIIFHDSEWPYTSFIFIFEKHTYFKYLLIVDDDNNATALIKEQNFYDELLIFLDDYDFLKIKQSAYMYDPYYKTYEQVFIDILKGENTDVLNVIKYTLNE